MADLKFRIIGDLKKLKLDLAKLMKEKFNVGVSATGGGGGAAAPKKQTSMLGGILKALAPIAILSSLKPIRDLLSLAVNFTGLIAFWLLTKVWNFLQNFVSSATQLSQNTSDTLKNIFNKLASDFPVLNIIKDIMSTLVSWDLVIIDTLKSIPGAIWNFLGNLPRMIWDFMRGGYSWVVKTLENVWGNIRDWLSLLKTTISSVITTIKEKLIMVKNSLVEKISTMIEFIKELPQRIWDFMKQLPQLIADHLKKVLSGGVSFITGGSGGGSALGGAAKIVGNLLGWGNSKKVGDAIITKNGQVLQTHPDDTIVASKSGGVGGTNVFNFYGVTQEEMIEEVKRVLGVQTQTSSRF